MDIFRWSLIEITDYVSNIRRTIVYMKPVVVTHVWSPWIVVIVLIAT